MGGHVATASQRRARRGGPSSLGGSSAPDAGFGLVELVVSMGVIAIIALVLVLGMGESFRAVASARQRSVATGLLSAADSQLQALPPGQLSTATPPSPVAVNAITYCTSWSSSASGQSPAVLYTFAITVTWPGCSGGTSVTSDVQVGGT